MEKTKLFIAPFGTEDWKEIDGVSFKTESLDLVNPDTCNKCWNEIHKDIMTGLSFSCECEINRGTMEMFISKTSPMRNLLAAATESRMVFGKKLHFEMSYDMYRYIQHICHRDFGCNLKRFFKENHIKVKVRYKTKNGYSVWMK